MKKKTVFGIIIIGFSLFSIVPNGFCLSETFYLEPEPYPINLNSSRIIGVQCVIGDIIQWRFKTYSDEFLVNLHYITFWNSKNLSEMKYTDSGLVTVEEYLHDSAHLKDVAFIFYNKDTKGGYISVYLNVITGYIIFFSVIGVCSIVGIVLVGILVIRRRKRKTSQ